MKYIIKRASGDPIGLRGLIPGEIHRIERCTKDFYDRNPVNWFNKHFTNIHLVTVAGSAYYEGVAKKAKSVYLYDVNNIEEMNALVEKVGPVIVYASDCAEGFPILEIYDYYIE